MLAIDQVSFERKSRGLSNWPIFWLYQVEIALCCHPFLPRMFQFKVQKYPKIVSLYLEMMSKNADLNVKFFKL